MNSLSGQSVVSDDGRLHVSARNALLDSDGQRMRLILEDRAIRYPILEWVVNQANWMVLEPVRSRARGLLVVAQEGNGKTSMAELIERRYKVGGTHAGPRCLSVSMTGIRDTRSFYGRILEVLSGPVRASHRLGDRELMVIRLLKDLGCRLLVLDEVHDILNGTERDQTRALEGVKFLMNRLHVPIIAFGTAHAGRAFSSDKDLAARFRIFELPPWKDDATLATFLATYERYLPLRKPSNLAAPAMATYLAAVGRGQLASIVERVQNAALLAIVEGEEAITLSIMERAESRPGACALVRKKKEAA